MAYVLKDRDIETKASLEDIAEVLKRNGLKVKVKKGVLTAKRKSMFDPRKNILVRINDAGDERIGTVQAGDTGDIDFRAIWKQVK